MNEIDVSCAVSFFTDIADNFKRRNRCLGN